MCNIIQIIYLLIKNNKCFFLINIVTDRMEQCLSKCLNRPSQNSQKYILRPDFDIGLNFTAKRSEQQRNGENNSQVVPKAALSLVYW